MYKLSLVIPAKKEKESLPKVLDEIKDYNVNKLVVLEPEDHETIDSIKDYECEIIYQQKKGYGDAIIKGINSVETKFFCIFNADGSFDPKELNNMMEKVDLEDFDIVFGTRYEKDCSSEDDTYITYIGNFIFTLLGKIFFKLKVSDILYTFVLGKSEKVHNLKLKSKNFVFCIELPIKAHRSGFKLVSFPCHEKRRIGGKKKVNAFRDGFLILISMIKLFFTKGINGNRTDVG